MPRPQIKVQKLKNNKTIQNKTIADAKPTIIQDIYPTDISRIIRLALPASGIIGKTTAGSSLARLAYHACHFLSLTIIKVKATAVAMPISGRANNDKLNNHRILGTSLLVKKTIK